MAYQSTDTATEYHRERFIADAENANVAEQIAERWTSELTIEGEESGMALTSRAAEEVRERITAAIAAVLKKELDAFDLANNGEVDFNEWMENN